MSDVAGWRSHGGTFAGTAALAHLLAHARVEAPEGLLGGESLPCSNAGSEALLLGLGGLGFWFNLYPGPWGVHLALGFTRPAGSGVYQRDVCRRLGIPVEIVETGNAVLAGRALREQVEAGRPVLLWGSKAAMPHLGVREELAPVTEHLWVVTGFGAERERYRVADLAPGPIELSVDEVAAARSVLFTAKHRRMTVEVADSHGEAESRDSRRPGLRRQVRDALTATLGALTEPLLPGQGLTGMARWAEALEDADSPRGWVRQLSTSAHLFDVLTELFRAVRLETDGALRDLEAAFLGEVADRIPVPALAEAETRYRDLAARWRELADAALPDGVPGLSEARRLFMERDRLYRREGWERDGESAARLEKLDRKLGEIRHEMDAGAVPSAHETRELLADLADRLRRIYKEETRAADALRATLDVLEEE